MLSCCGSICAQSPFDLSYISDKPKVVVVRYDGSVGSVADTDTVKLRPFKFLSIGELKKMSATANGCVYTLFTYVGGQYVLVKSVTGGGQPMQLKSWKSSSKSKVEECFSSENIVNYKKKRQIYVMNYGDAEIFIVNIKPGKVDLFKYLGSTLEFLSTK